MNPMLPNLLGDKMSSSHPPNTKIMFLDSAEAVTQKICEANTNWTNGTTNGVMVSLRDILIPISEFRWGRLLKGEDHRQPFCSKDAPTGTVFSIVDGEGESRHYRSYEEIQHDLTENKVSSQVLNSAVANAFNQLLEPVRRMYDESDDWQRIDKLAYPEDA
jgi:tyrosyl-tRNA synthetase